MNKPRLTRLMVPDEPDSGRHSRGHPAPLRGHVLPTEQRVLGTRTIDRWRLSRSFCPHDRHRLSVPLDWQAQRARRRFRRTARLRDQLSVLRVHGRRAKLYTRAHDALPDGSEIILGHTLLAWVDHGMTCEVSFHGHSQVNVDLDEAEADATVFVSPKRAVGCSTDLGDNPVRKGVHLLPSWGRQLWLGSGRTLMLARVQSDKPRTWATSGRPPPSPGAGADDLVCRDETL